MKKERKKWMSLVLVGALVITSVFVPGQQTDAKAKVKLNKKKLVLTVGKKAKLKVKGTKKKVKWYSSKKKIATVTKKGVVKAKKKGTAKIVAKIGKKKYTCKVVVKAKKKAKVTSKPKAVAKVTAKPKATAKVTANPGTLPSKNPQVSDNPSQTTQPSEEGDPTTAKIILNDNVATTWNAYHRPLKDVTVTEAATIRIGYTDIFDGSLYYTNTYGREMSLDELKSHEGEEFGQGFWKNHPRNDQSFTLQTGTVNTIYVRLVDNMTETVYYLNSDKIIVQGAAQKTPEPSASASPSATPTSGTTSTPTPAPTNAPTGTPTAVPSKTPSVTPTAAPSKTPSVTPTAVPSSSGLTVGNRQLSVGMTKTAFNNALASKSTDVKREEKSPQGFDVIAFRENGNNSSLSGNQYDQKYSTYILAYLQDNEVIGITAIAPGMSYAGEVSYGTPASTLASNGWTSVDWYLAGSAAGAYTKTIKGTEVIAFVDALGSNQVYCIQAFSDSFLVDDMTNVSETTLQLNYPAEVQTAMATESGELLNAYLVNQGQSAFRINTKLSAAAKSYSSEIVSAGIIDASDASRSSSDIRSSIRAAGIAPGAWGERVLIGNMDAIGFANSMIESSGARALLWSGDYAVMGLGAGAYNDGTVYYPNLVIDLIDKVKLI
ncbi:MULTISPECIES: Ig-like domain-containing protein [unclassified Clostridium]|uniref:Ig-like domain-containing protein n=1 Tax=unclassified Clostridium TaxID=2614128 RepID=UPI001FA9D6A5|nr:MULTISPECIES: Ig-like domain-containing protein [unclassified Clostridium]